MRILFVSRWYPYPPDNGSKIRIFNLIRRLSARHEVDLISFASEPVGGKELDAMRALCRDAQVTGYHPRRNGKLASLLGYFSSLPRSMVASHSREMQALVDEADRSGEYGLAIFSQVDMIPYASRWRSSPKVLEELEVSVLFEQAANVQTPTRRARGRMTWWKQARYLREALKSFQGCTVVSEMERGRVLQVAPGICPVEVIPNGVDTAYYRGEYGPREPDTLVYSGALTYFANLDAMQYFLREVFPLVRAKRPEARLSITGSTGGVDLGTLPDVEGVEFTGYVEDIRPVIARSQVSIAPLRIGGGTRLKILEAMALGTPVVSTSKGAEGLELTPGKDVLVADTPEAFARAIVDVLEDPALAEKLSCEGLETVERRYDWATIGEKLEAFLERTAAGERVERAARV